MDIWEIQVKGPNTDILAEVLKTGDKVLVTRTVTYTYEVDMSEWLVDSDETEVSVESFIKTITDETDASNEGDIEDDVVTSVEYL